MPSNMAKKDIGWMSMFQTKGFLARFLGDESGVAAAEYALWLAIIAAGLAVAAASFGTSPTAAMTDASNCIDEGSNCTP